MMNGFCQTIFDNARAGGWISTTTDAVNTVSLSFYEPGDTAERVAAFAAERFAAKYPAAAYPFTVVLTRLAYEGKNEIFEATPPPAVKWNVTRTCTR